MLETCTSMIFPDFQRQMEWCQSYSRKMSLKAYIYRYMGTMLFSKDDYHLQTGILTITYRKPTHSPFCTHCMGFFAQHQKRNFMYGVPKPAFKIVSKSTAIQCDIRLWVDQKHTKHTVLGPLYF